jgi:hydrogenase nickel incorporation protein HypB
MPIKMHKVTVDVSKDLLAANKKIARENARTLAQYGIKAYEFLGAIGSGKTSIIARLVESFSAGGVRAGAVCGDVAGDDDCRRLQALGIPAVNINTGKACHLDAHLVEHALAELPLERIDVLFIENVGNLVCPADFPLGAEKRFVVISVTEGEDIVRKHPTLFALADCVIINKTDLAETMEVSPQKLGSDVRCVKPEMPVFFVCARSGAGIREFREEALAV